MADYRLLDKLNLDLMTMAVQLYKKSIEDTPKENILFSPLAIAFGLGTIEIGSRKEAQDELHRHLLPSMGLDDGASAFAAAMDSIKGDTGQKREYRMNFINLLYIDNHFKLIENFVQNAQKCFDARTSNVDFQKKSDPTRLDINEYVLEHSEYKIRNLFPPGALDSDDRIVMINALHLAAEWAVYNPFINGRTYSRLFYPPNNAPGVEVPMMSLEATFRYYEEPDIQVLGIDYKNRELTLFLLLPTNREGLAQIERTMDAKELNRLMNAVQDAKVFATIPKFAISYRLRLRDMLKATGVKLIFDVVGDMSGISKKKDMFITNAVHQAFFKVRISISTFFRHCSTCNAIS